MGAFFGLTCSAHSPHVAFDRPQPSFGGPAAATCRGTISSQFPQMLALPFCSVNIHSNIIGFSFRSTISAKCTKHTADVRPYPTIRSLCTPVFLSGNRCPSATTSLGVDTRRWIGHETGMSMVNGGHGGGSRKAGTAVASAKYTSVGRRALLTAMRQGFEQGSGSRQRSLVDLSPGWYTPLTVVPLIVHAHFGLPLYPLRRECCRRLTRTSFTR